jgi:clan AA aspartic protease
MITGSVNGRREAVFKIEVQDADGNSHFSDAVIDTGFNRFLALPTAIIRALELRKLGQEPAELGDGSVEKFDIYNAVVIWEGLRRLIVVHATDPFPIVGMQLLDRHELRIQVAEGGAVTIEAMP